MKLPIPSPLLSLRILRIVPSPVPHVTAPRRSRDALLSRCVRSFEPIRRRRRVCASGFAQRNVIERGVAAAQHQEQRHRSAPHSCRLRLLFFFSPSSSRCDGRLLYGEVSAARDPTAERTNKERRGQRPVSHRANQQTRRGDSKQGEEPPLRSSLPFTQTQTYSLQSSCAVTPPPAAPLPSPNSPCSFFFFVLPQLACSGHTNRQHRWKGKDEGVNRLHAEIR